MSSIYLIALGLFLGILELLIGSFYIIFFAIGFLIIGAINFINPLSLANQLALVAIISIFLLIIFKKFFKRKNISTYNDDFLNESGEGIIKNGMIYYKGSFWQSNEISHLKDGDIVQIRGIENNKIILKDKS